MAKPSFYIFGMPSPSTVRALGRVAIRQSQLDQMLRMTFKILAELPARQALDETLRDGSKKLRKRIRKLAKDRLGEGVAFASLQKLLKRAENATDQRNDVIHGVCGREVDDTIPQLLLNDDHSMRPFPTAEELDDLAAELVAITKELNEARLEGFISTAMAERK